MMTPLFAKLNLGDRKEIVVLGAPESFEAELDALEGIAVRRDAKKLSSASFVLAFATKLAEVERIAKRLPELEGDPVVWFAYPKGSSKRYRCEFNRDTGWASVGEAGFEAVRQVAIDEDWSALRFRRASFIRELRRDPSRAGSAEGKKRASSRKKA